RFTAPPYRLSSEVGHDVGMPHRYTCRLWALANISGERLALAATTPAFLRNSRRFITGPPGASFLSNARSIPRGARRDAQVPRRHGSSRARRPVLPAGSGVF